MKKRIFRVNIAVFLAIFFSFQKIYAVDITWQKNNDAILTNNSIIESAIRWIGFGIAKLVCLLADVCENLYDKTFGMIDITKYSGVESLITKFKPVIVALVILCLIGYGISLMVTNEKKPILTNILLGIVAVSCSLFAFDTANSLVKNFKTGILGEYKSTQSYQLINNNMIDLVNIDRAGKITQLNYAAGSGVLHNAGIHNKKAMNEININETLNWDDKKEGQDLYNWSDTFNNYIKYKAVKVNGQYKAAEVYDGALMTTIGNEFYYRYDFDFWSCILQLISLILMFIALSYKNVRIVYELIVARIFAAFFSADVGGGQRLRQIMMFIRDTYITLCVSVLSVKLYLILTEAIVNFGITGISKGIVSIFIAYAVIDGPNLVERLLGMDAGLSSSMGRTMALLSLTRKGARTSKRAISSSGRKVLGAVSGRTSNENNSFNKTRFMDKNSSSSKPGNKDKDKTIKGMNEKSNSFKQDERDNDKTSRSSINKNLGANSNKNDTESFMRDDSKNDFNSSDKNNFISTKDSYDTSFMSNSSVTHQRVKNQEFSDAVKRLTPSSSSSDAERRDFNRQVNNIVKGNHKAIKPKRGTRAEYKFKNYEKAKELEKAYNSYNKTVKTTKTIKNTERKEENYAKKHNNKHRK